MRPPVSESAFSYSTKKGDPVRLSFPVQPNNAHKPDNRRFGCGQALKLGLKDECLYRMFHIGGHFTTQIICVNGKFCKVLFDGQIFRPFLHFYAHLRHENQGVRWHSACSQALSTIGAGTLTPVVAMQLRNFIV